MPVDNHAYAAHLLALYRDELRRQDNPYLRSHSASRGALDRQITTAGWFLPYVRGRVLDWGCAHAPDACMIRLHHGADVEIHGCDVGPPDAFPVFHGYADLQYRQLRHAYQLPYPDDFFDVVIGDGVLEHVPNDRESLKELYRVLKTNGILVFSCLPNCWSYLEGLSRLLRLPHHLRTYRMGQARELLLHSGFLVFQARHYQMVPSLSGMAMVTRSRLLQRFCSWLWSANALVERAWPINRLSSNLFLLARKVPAISWELLNQAA